MIKTLLSRLRHNQRGNVTIMFGLSAVPLIVGLGIGIDLYTRFSYKTRYDAAADAAALAGATSAQAYITANSASLTSSVLIANAIATGQATEAKIFTANAGTASTSVPVTPTFSITLAPNSTTLVSQASYTGSMKMNFGPLVGAPTTHISGQASASLGLTTYANYYILVDTSGSMGIGSTASDMALLYTATKNSTDGGSCVFACHGHYSTTDTSPDNEALARSASPPITLRIDAAKVAVQTMIAQAKNTPGNTGNIKIGLYTMELNGTNNTYIKTLSSLSTDYTALTSAANGIDLSLFVNNHTNDPGWTDAKDALTALASIIPASGNGLTAATPINYAFIVSDGVQDMIGSCDSNGHCSGPIDQTACATLKAKATVGTIYTTYLPIYNNNNPANGFISFYATEVAPFASQIGPNMQNCASTNSLAYQASDGPTLIAAMQQLFKSTNQPMALSQ